ncbi:phosphate ABC transporter permease PstA [Streptomyces griseoruber]|uniref:phosphate ABC transporter permease PstA n=1 Tax=Streptomyces griseoruber TaxID=1943 RepID=UPI003796A378
MTTTLDKAGTVTTVVPRPEPPDEPEEHRRLGGPRRDDLLALGGAATTGLSLAWLLFGELAPLSGPFGFVVVACLIFLLVYAVLVWMDTSAAGGSSAGPLVRDRLLTVVLHCAAVLLFAALVLVIGFTAVRGWRALPHAGFYTQDMQAAGPLDPITVGGVRHAVAGTLIQIGIALAITIPLGITCAVYLGQVPGRFSRFVRTIVEAMTALPSIVAGLFVYASWILMLGFEKSGLAAGLAISVMMLPIVIRAADVVLRLVPGTLTEAAEALGAPRWRTVWHVVLPSARSGLATAVILGTARGIGETSPVLLTAGATAALNVDPARGPMMSLPLAVFTFIRSPQPAMITRAFGTALVLLALVLLLFTLARVVGGRGPGHLSPRQSRRADRRSQRDLRRFEAPTSALAEPTSALAEPASVPVEPTPVPAEPASAPVEPASVPVEPTPVPAEPASAPVEPASVPVEPTPAPADPTPAPAEVD